jgi:hypothetical protein
MSRTRNGGCRSAYSEKNLEPVANTARATQHIVTADGKLGRRTNELFAPERVCGPAHLARAEINIECGNKPTGASDTTNSATNIVMTCARVSALRLLDGSQCLDASLDLGNPRLQLGIRVLP